MIDTLLKSLSVFVYASKYKSRLGYFQDYDNKNIYLACWMRLASPRYRKEEHTPSVLALFRISKICQISRWQWQWNYLPLPGISGQ